MSKIDTLPHWDMNVVHPSLESESFELEFASMISALEMLTTQFDQHNIDQQPATAVDKAISQTFNQIVTQYNTVLEQVITLNAYMMSFVVTNSHDDYAQAKLSELRQHLAQLTVLSVRLTGWLGSLDIDALCEQSAIAKAHHHMLTLAKIEAQHLMSPTEENLAAELSLTGSNSWMRMFSDYTSQLMVSVVVDDEMQELPLPAAQNLAYNEDRLTRERAYYAVTDALDSIKLPIAAALNSIKGETINLCRRRGWESPLEMAIHENAIDAPTLEAMMDATRHAFPDFHRYLKARARALGIPKLRWYDRLVPLGKATKEWSFEEGSQFVIEQFATYSDKMAQMAQRAFRENWIDAQPREGKRGGAFCMWLRHGESRILANYQPSFTSVGTLAHELGHAYHNLNLAKRTYLQRTTPMTLAETASTFCQKIVENAALQTAVPQDQFIILDGLLEYATRVVIGVSGDFLFESALFEQRAKRELSADELCDLMLSAQKETLGDAIDLETLYPYRWVYVPHYYGSSYYNFPYTFGLLFGLGLYAKYQQGFAEFHQKYDALLSATGMSNAADLAEQFGINIRQPQFWHESLDVLRADIDRFEALVDQKVGA